MTPMRDASGRFVSGGGSGIVVRADHTAKITAKMHAAAAAALKEAADELLKTASETVPVAPVGGGFLRDSGKAEVDEIGLSAQVYYDTPTPDNDNRASFGSLALMVHENTKVTHITGRAKWLEQAAKETAMRLGIKIGMSIKGKMR